MKTLSDDITIKLPTTGMAEGYVTTKIYANGIGVFTGRSYIPGDDSSLYVNVNDIAIQTRGKYDYLKLNDDGKVETVPLVNDVLSTYSYQRRWNKGQVGNYKVNITDNNNAYEDSEYVLTGYDYPNRDLKPTSMNEEDSSLCRIMQGCNWIYNHDEEIGDFLNLLLPHYPLVKTDKYGIGLQISAGGMPFIPNTPYSLRSVMGSEVELGSPIYGLSNTTFLTLNDLINGITGLDDNDSDVSIYLKQSGTSGDEFGDLIEGYDRYKAQLTLERMNYKAYSNTILVIDTNYDVSTNIGKQCVQRYIDNILTDWDYNKIASGDTMIFDSGWLNNLTQVLAAVGEYIYNNAQGTYVELLPSEEMDDITSVILTPITSQENFEEYAPDIYYGTCPVAILDRCYSRYYLAWNDRYGDIMSQPFNGKIEYSEDFERNEIKDYKLRRRVIHNELQPKWKLNTKWLNEDIYPMYESIFTSPYLLLYDTKTDRSWNVILTDSEYKEKSFNTEKTLFNLEINVEANTRLNFIF